MNRAAIVQQLAREIGVTPAEMERVIISAPYRYKFYKISKRSGGTREIRQPSPEIKAVQAWLVKNVISRLPVHKGVYSYRRGVGIRITRPLICKGAIF
jgi:hypothetical protein